jgi:hypothetical protein
MATIEIVSVRNCKYASEDNSAIDCEVQFSHLYTEDESGNKTYQFYPFTAIATDVEKHGRDIFANAKNGDYGSISSFSHISHEAEMIRVRNKRNSLLLETDWTQNSDVPQATKDKWSTYRQQLRDITSGLDTAAKARSVTWPTKPS